MKKDKIFIGVVAILVLFSLSAFAQNKTAALIVNSDLMPNGFDKAMHDRLETIGYNVKVVPSTDIPSWFDVDSVNACDLLLISESIGSSSADPFIGTTTPVMHNEAYGWDNWHATIGASITWQNVGDVDIVNDTHPIAVEAGVSAGSVSFFDPATGTTTDYVSALAPGAEIIAQTTISQDYALIFTIDEGAELADNSLAPARFAGFSIPADLAVSYTASNMTDDAWALWEATIKWLTDASVNVDDKSVAATPAQFELAQNYPNPFNPRTKIEFSISKKAKVKLEVFDIKGGTVAILLDEVRTPGNYSAEFNGSNLSSGFYVYKLTADNISFSKKMLLLK